MCLSLHFKSSMNLEWNLTYTLSPINKFGEYIATIELAPGIESGTFKFGFSDTVEERKIYLRPILFSASKVPTKGGYLTITGVNLKYEKYFSQYTEIHSITKQYNVSSVKFSDDYRKFMIPVDEGTGHIIFYGFINDDKIEAYTSYENPSISSSINNETLLSLIGNNLGKHLSVVKVWIGGIPLDPNRLVYVDHQLLQIKCEDITRTSKIDVNVTVDDLNNFENYQVQIKPKIYSITSVPYKGGKVTIQGSFLNVKRSDGNETDITIDIGKYKCLNPINPFENNFTTIICDMPEGTGDNLPLSISIDGIKSNNDVSFSYAYPHIQKIYQDGNEISIYGESLGTVDNSSVKFNGQEYKPESVETLANATEILKFKIKSDCRNGEVKMTVNKYKGSNPVYLELVPEITSINTLSTRGGVVRLSGKFLNIKDIDLKNLESSLTFSNPELKCSNLRELDPPTGADLECELPAGSGEYNASIKIASKHSPSIKFSYTPPRIVGYKQHYGEIVLSGENFGPKSEDISIKYNKENLSSESVTDHTQLVFVVPPLSQSGLHLKISVSGQESNSVQVNLNPVISNISSLPASGGILTISGNFLDLSKNDTSLFISIAGYSCPNITGEPTTHQSIYCNLSPGVGTNHALNFTIDGIPVMNPKSLQFSYDKPSVVSATPVNPIERNVVSISGSSFNMPIDVTIGNRVCEYPNVTDYNLITCSLPKWLGDFDDVPNDEQYVNVSVGGQFGGDSVFLYNLTTINAIKAARQASRLKWLIPAILIPALFGITCIVALSIILYKRHKKMKDLKKMFKENNQ
eukprot:gene11107-13591_t